MRALRFVVVIVGFEAACVLLLSFLIPYDALADGDFDPLPRLTAYKQAVGHHCAFCGMTRSFTAISHGRFDVAVAQNRFGPVVYGVFCVFAFASVVILLFSRREEGISAGIR